MAYLIQATDQEKRAYKETQPVYPLHCWVKHNGVKMAVETWGPQRPGSDDPKYGVVAPEGHCFKDAWTTYENCRSIQEVLDVAGMYPVVPMEQEA